MTCLTCHSGDPLPSWTTLRLSAATRRVARTQASLIGRRGSVLDVADRVQGRAYRSKFVSSIVGSEALDW